MAQPVEFRGQNRVFTAPPGEEDRCGNLPVFQNRGMTVSCWELSDEEIREVLRTGKIWLSVQGHSIVPMFVGSESTVRELTAEAGPLPRQNAK